MLRGVPMAWFFSVSLTGAQNKAGRNTGFIFWNFVNAAFRGNARKCIRPSARQHARIARVGTVLNAIIYQRIDFIGFIENRVDTELRAAHAHIGRRVIA